MVGVMAMVSDSCQNVSKEIQKLELEQTFMRLILVLSAVVYGVIIISIVGASEIKNAGSIVVLGYSYIAISCIGILQVYFWPIGSKRRHTIYMVLDVLVTSIVMHNFGKFGIPYFVLYSWLTVGNGFRYGYTELIFCSGISLIGFIFVFLTTPFWRNEYLISVTCVMLLSVIPIYVAVMLRRLQSAKVRLEQASQEKSRFIANVSHEIRTPLNVIVGLGSMMDKVSADEQREMMMRVKEASGTLMDLVEGVLDMSRIERGDVEIRHESFDLPQLLASVEGIFSLQADKKGLQLRSRIDSALPENVVGDQQRLRQVLINLIGNAVKFTEKGSVETRVTRVRKETGGEDICFEVIDTGPGMTGEFLSHIFDRFRQENSTIARRFGGTGLGTSISHNLVELMGGRMGVQSVYGQGSRFWFTHPLVPADAAEHSVRGSDVTGPAVEHIPGKRGRVLVVEDNEINCYVYQTMLGYLGVEADIAGSGAIALEKLARERYDMLVFDMQIPGMSGAETIARYNGTVPPAERPPIIVITADATTEIERTCRQLGVQSLLAKPVSIERIRELVQRCMVVQDRKCVAQG